MSILKDKPVFFWIFNLTLILVGLTACTEVHRVSDVFGML